MLDKFIVVEDWFSPIHFGLNKGFNQLWIRIIFWLWAIKWILFLRSHGKDSFNCRPIQLIHEGIIFGKLLKKLIPFTFLFQSMKPLLNLSETFIEAYLFWKVMQKNLVIVLNSPFLAKQALFWIVIWSILHDWPSFDFEIILCKRWSHWYKVRFLLCCKANSDILLLRLCPLKYGGINWYIIFKFFLFLLIKLFENFRGADILIWLKLVSFTDHTALSGSNVVVECVKSTEVIVVILLCCAWLHVGMPGGQVRVTSTVKHLVVSHIGSACLFQWLILALYWLFGNHYFVCIDFLQRLPFSFYNMFLMDACLHWNL